MKKILIVVMIVFMFVGCSVSNSDKVNFQGENVKYVEDSRTGIIFAVTSSRLAFQLDTTGLGIAVIPEDYRDRVEPYLEK